MGDWGSRAWESDSAADWFARFWRDGWGLVTAEVEGFAPEAERFDELRAAAHVLGAFGSPYMVPSEHLDGLAALLDRAVVILGAMIEPPDETWAFLEICEGDAAVIADVRSQIELLQSRRAEIAGR